MAHDLHRELEDGKSSTAWLENGITLPLEPEWQSAVESLIRKRVKKAVRVTFANDRNEDGPRLLIKVYIPKNYKVSDFDDFFGLENRISDLIAPEGLGFEVDVIPALAATKTSKAKARKARRSAT